MKKNFVIPGLLFCLLCLFFSSCEREEALPPYHAKGKIILITVRCYGEAVLIEVENPKGIGLKGTFSTFNKDNDLSYENAIRVPYFSRVGLPDSIPQVIGTNLYFEYRDITTEEWENNNPFLPSEPIICLDLLGPPPSKVYVITKILSFN